MPTGYMIKKIIAQIWVIIKKKSSEIKTPSPDIQHFKRNLKF